MLTNIFYYNYYKPYMIHSYEGNDTAVKPKRSKISDKSYNSTDKFVILNKSIKNEVIKYAGNVSSGVNNLKDTAKSTILDMESLNKNSAAKGEATAKGWIEEDIKEFTQTYNQSMVFFANQKQSTALKEFSYEMQNLIDYNAEKLKLLGISADENGKLVFNKNEFNGLTRPALDTAIGESIDVFQNIYDISTNMLTVPLLTHMGFKELNYHYSYKLGTVVTDSFNMIEAGMLIDKVV